MEPDQFESGAMRCKEYISLKWEKIQSRTIAILCQLLVDGVVVHSDNSHKANIVAPFIDATRFFWCQFDRVCKL